MKILQIGKFLPPHKGGMEHSILHLCRKLQEETEHEISLCAAGEEHESQKKEKFRFVPYKELLRFASTPISFGLFKILKKEDPELIHIHLPNPWWTLHLLFSRKPIIATYHCDVVTYPILKYFYQFFLDLFLKKCHAIIATSPQIIETNRDLQKFRSKVKMISLTVPPMTLDEYSRTQRDLLVRQYGDRFILFVGRLVPYKGLNYLLQAMKSVQGRLVLIGKGPLLEDLKAQVAELGVQDRVVFAGAVSDEDLPAFYHATAIVVLSSVTDAEALGVCLIEGLSAGKPLVTTRLSTGVGYVNKENYTGLCVNPRDPAALAHALNQILDSRELREKFESNAKAHYEDLFSSEVIIEAHKNLYQAAIQQI